MARDKNAPNRPLATNKKARHDYHVLETLEVGIALRGTEVKAIRQSNVQLREAHVQIKNGEAWLMGAHIGAYSHGNRENHEAERPRKLLASRRELDRLVGQTQTKGLTIVPLSIYTKGNWIKLEIALVRGKKLFDKRETEKRKELEKEARVAMAEVNRR
ncbi:MAG: SsrA-binding protein SmpB [Thermoanaerobaculia bacterium]|nr:SsrA-binding protein SmpB [Thermoanaerobaculia bacterium]